MTGSEVVGAAWSSSEPGNSALSDDGLGNDSVDNASFAILGLLLWKNILGRDASTMPAAEAAKMLNVDWANDGRCRLLTGGGTPMLYPSPSLAWILSIPRVASLIPSVINTASRS